MQISPKQAYKQVFSVRVFSRWCFFCFYPSGNSHKYRACKRARTLSRMLKDPGIIKIRRKCSIRACVARTDVVYILNLLGHSPSLLTLPWNHQAMEFLSQNRPVLERQMTPGYTNVGVTPFWWLFPLPPKKTNRQTKIFKSLPLYVLNFASMYVCFLVFLV